MGTGGQIHAVGYAVGTQYAVGMQYAVGVSAKMSHMVGYAVGTQYVDVSAKRSNPHSEVHSKYAVRSRC